MYGISMKAKWHHVKRWMIRLILPITVLVLLLFSWIMWSDWPNPQKGSVFTNPDAIVILGGGDSARWAHGLDLANQHPSVPIIVTGDGGAIVTYFDEHGLSGFRIIHEQHATSTVENAKFTRPILNALNAHRVILVTNWFHQPRSSAIFDRYQPQREFCVSFSPKPDPMQPWDILTHRRERLAVLHNLVFHGVWSW
jgi:uncharacterized SAM-binding protein YcdF (DUF218 family)